MDKTEVNEFNIFVSSFIRSVIKSAVVEYEDDRELKRKTKEHRKIMSLLDECQCRTSKLFKQMYFGQIRDTATCSEEVPHLRPKDVAAAQRCATQPSHGKTNLYAQDPEAPIVNTTRGQFLTYTTNATGTYCHFYNDNYVGSNKACEATNYITDYTDEKHNAGDSKEHGILQRSPKPLTQTKPKSRIGKLVKLLTCCISKKNIN